MEKKDKKNFWVAGLILLGVIFGLLSAWSFYRAGREASPVVDPDYYDRGIKYNESQTSQKAAEDMGWHAVVKVDGRRIVVRLSDADKSPVTGCRAQISLHQPLGATTPSNLVLHEVAPGTYAAELPPYLVGTFPAELSLSQNNLLLERQVLLNTRRD
ncbi:MAG: FixH family protein [Deltaproteobacteria bacterium]|jgi:nitrogen fixation protein FixH|nr:FixH family protein [Deltaproteobacteria bacterium]